MPARSSIALAASRKSALSSTIKQRTSHPVANTLSSFADVDHDRIPASRNSHRRNNQWAVSCCRGQMNQHSTSEHDPRPLNARLLALVVRPTSPPVWLGIVVAAVFIGAETLVVHLLQRIAPENAFGVLFLVGVLVVSAGWGFRLAVATTLASAVVYVQFHMDTGTGFLPTHP